MSETQPTQRKITVTDAAELLGALDVPLPATRGRRFALLIFCEREAQLRMLDDGAEVVVGRKEPAEIVVGDNSVSRQHARLTRLGSEVWVEDLDSRHGTFLRGRKIEREKLEPFDELTIGKARIVLAATAEPPADAPIEPAGDDSGPVIVSPRMKRLYDDVARAARGRLPVLVLGETGSGKELIAQAVHRASMRKDQPFVAVNCAAIAPSLLESALFGHERGAFTGALQRSQGVFERASGGVLFLDEVGDLTASAQVALLRAIETQKIVRLGSTQELAVDVQLIAATHCDLEAMVEEGSFRRDLYFRLSGVQFLVPPLRERAEEIEPLSRSFLVRACREWKLPALDFAPETLAALRRCAWPGNVRQLRYAVERAALLASERVIAVTDLPEAVTSDLPPHNDAAKAPPLAPELGLKQQLRRYERALIDEALRRSGGNRQSAAKLLRIPLRTLFRKLRPAGEGEPDPDLVD